MLTVGMKAPDFTLQDKSGKAVSLSDFLGKKVVLYFYPKDNTPGCTRQACAFGQAFDAFEEKNAVVIGVSKDSPAALSRFGEELLSLLDLQERLVGTDGDMLLGKWLEKAKEIGFFNQEYMLPGRNEDMNISVDLTPEVEDNNRIYDPTVEYVQVSLFDLPELSEPKLTEKEKEVDDVEI